LATWNQREHDHPLLGTNGLLRQYLPKRCNLGAYSDTQLQHIEDKLNQPENGIATFMWLGFRTPQRVFDASFKLAALRS
jgi:IS30 family transposase